MKLKGTVEITKNLVAGTDIQVGNSGSLKLANSGSTAFINLKAAAGLGSDITLTFPTTAGTNGQALTTNGSGTLAWSTVSGGSSLPVADTTSIVQGSADSTKQVRFEVDGLTTETVRVLTPQDANYTLAGTNLAQTFSALQTFNSGTTPADIIALSIAQPGSAGTRDSHSLSLRGTAYDTGGHNSDWKLFVNPTANTGSSRLVLQSRIDSNSFADRFSINELGNLLVRTAAGNSVKNLDLGPASSSFTSELQSYIDTAQSSIVSANSGAVKPYGIALGIEDSTSAGGAPVNIGLLAFAGTTHSSGTKTQVSGAQIFAKSNSAQTTTFLVGAEVYPDNEGAGTVTNAIGLRVNSAFNNGTITNLYGIYVQNYQSLSGATNKWAILTEAGKVEFKSSGNSENVLQLTAFSTSHTGRLLSLNDNAGNTNISMSTGTTTYLQLGRASAVTGKLILAAAGSANVTTIQSAETPASGVIYLLPADNPANGEFLKVTSFSGGTAALEWAAASGGGTPGGSSGQLQYNSSSTFAGTSGITTDGSSLTATTAYNISTTAQYGASVILNSSNAVKFTSGAGITGIDTAIVRSAAAGIGFTNNGSAGAFTEYKDLNLGASAATPSAGAFRIYSKTVSSISRPFVKLSDGSDLELSSTTDKAISLLSTTTSVSLTSTGTTTLYTVPSGKTALVTSAVVIGTSVSGVTVAPAVGVGVGAGEDDVMDSRTLIGLAANGSTNVLTAMAASRTVPSGGVLKLGVDTAATASSMTVTVMVFGILY
jgi:hypothetical protein